MGTFSGDQNGCKNGGLIYAAGSPPVNAYVCNGLDGTNGTGTRADGPCFDDVNRYVDCENGTVTDTLTGVIWLKQANCLPTNTWVAANQAAAGLKHGDCGLTDSSSAGDWRLPTREEWGAMISQSCGPNTPAILNDAGTACYGNGAGSSFVGVEDERYWSSTSATSADRARVFDLNDAVSEALIKTSILRAWPVRVGPR
jgi:hypothetical protein